MVRTTTIKVAATSLLSPLEFTRRINAESHYAKTFSLEHAEMLWAAYAPGIDGMFISANTALSSRTAETIAKGMAVGNLKVEARVVGRREAKARRRTSGD